MVEVTDEGRLRAKRAAVRRLTARRSRSSVQPSNREDHKNRDPPQQVCVPPGPSALILPSVILGPLGLVGLAPAWR